ncbi:MAG TPA: tetratricopeptide repeat protein [Candidatus Hydrogenedentes bacterium]|nr:tetratricopeptide repeat protein [Candidatus Hydrogenedentota bacterium]
MSRSTWWLFGAACVVAVTLTGCNTTGSQLETTIYDMHKRVVKLDKDLGESITKLNETAATLNARVDEMDQQTRQLGLLIENNQKRLDDLSKDLARFRADVYRHLGITASVPGAVGGTPNVSVGQPMIETPGGVTTPAPPAPAGTVVQGRNELVDSAPSPLPAAQAAPVQPTPAPAQPAMDERTLYATAQRAQESGDLEGALKLFDEYLTRFPNGEQAANAYFWKGKCQLDLNRHADAVQTYETLRSKYPNNTKTPYAMYNQAVAHVRLGQTAEAARLMQAIIDQFPMSPVAEQAKNDIKKLTGSR